MQRRLLLVALSLLVLTAVTVAPAAAASPWPTYVVKSGDTLSRIAASHNVTLAKMIAANGSVAPYLIYPGQVLYIPDLDAPIFIDSIANGATVTSPITVTGHSTTFEGALSVRVRDRYGAVLATANTHGGSMGVIGAFTAVLTFTVPYNMWGSVEAYTQSAATGAEVSNTGVRVTLTKSGAAYRTYIVKKGDNLSRIALKYGTTWRVLASLNGLANPNRVFVGQKLLIP